MIKATKRSKMLALLLAVMMVFVFTACEAGDKNTDSSQENSVSQKESGADSAESTPVSGENDGEGFTPGITMEDEGSITVFAFSEGQNYEKVFKKFEEVTKNSLKTTVNFHWATAIKDEQPLKLAEQGDIDLIFDAGWLNSANNISQGMYKDISEYFNNPAYPGLQKAFPPEVVESMKNAADGKIYGIPFFTEYNNLRTIIYREDWREKLGCDPIVDDDTLEAYLIAVNENKEELGAASAVGLGDRGFYYFQDYSHKLNRENIFEVPGTGARITQYAYVLLNDTHDEVLDVAYVGDPAEEHPLFPDPDFLNERTMKLADRWFQYVNEDAVSISGQDVADKFKAGLYGAIEKELSAYAELTRDLTAYDSEAKVGYYFYDEELSAQEQVYMEKDVSNNLLYVPYFNDNPDRAMAVLDWIFDSQANNDLFSRGIEGEDWQAVGEKEYTELQPDNKYVFPTWLWSNNANYVRQESGLPEDVSGYITYARSSDNFKTNPVAGFNFDTAPVTMEYTAFTTAQQDYYPMFMNGGFGAETQTKLDEFYQQTKPYSDVLKEEVKKQLTEYFANK